VKTSSEFKGFSGCQFQTNQSFAFASTVNFSNNSFFSGTAHWKETKIHPGLDMRALSQKIKDLKLAGRSIEEIAKEIDPKEFENMWR
jgi:hypothetical protein